MDALLLERLNKFNELHLGLERNNLIVLAPHHPKWKRVFSDEAYLILHSLNLESLKLYHCGSTSIPGICAKPIIDIVGSVKNLELFDQSKEKLEALGYEYKGEYGIKGRRYSVLYNPEKTHSFCHLHIFKENSRELHDHIIFRDYLRLNIDAAQKYEKHKKSIDLPRDQYTEAKSNLISELLNKANSYYEPNIKEKMLVILGAANGHKNTMNFIENLFVNNDVEILDLNEIKIDPYDHKGNNDIDDFISTIEKMITFDRVVFATPVYWYAMSGEMKDFVDRFSDLLRAKYKNLGEQLYGKKIDLLSTGSDLELPNGFTIPFNLTCTYFGMDFMNVYYRSMNS
jgi:GrpB-like predicted nucleotidyltransferase (UPF0157 family)